MQNGFYILLALIVTCGQLHAEEGQESRENAVLALAILNDAIAKQDRLIRQFAGSAENEAPLRLKLAETLQKKAQLLSRLPGEAKEYERTLRQQIFAFRWLVDHCEANHNCPISYLGRGTARKNLNQPLEAKKDFAYAVDHYPSEPGVELVLFQLAQLEMDAGEFSNAVKHLLILQNQPGKIDLATILEKISWAYAGTGDYVKALETTKKAQVSAKKTRKTKVSPALLALNTAIFYVRGMETGLPGFTGKDAVSYFQSNIGVDELAIALRAFPSLITKEELVQELESFSDTLVANRPELAATWDVVRATVERDSSLRRLSGLEKALGHLVKYQQGQPESTKEGLATTIRRVEKNLLSLIAETSTTPPTRAQALSALRKDYELAHYYFKPGTEAATQFEFNLGALEYSQGNYDAAEEHLKLAMESKQGRKNPKLAPLRKQAAREIVDVGYRRLKKSIGDSQTEISKIATLLEKWDATIKNIPSQLQSQPEIATMKYDLARSLFLAKREELAAPRLKIVISENEKEVEKRDAMKLLSAYYIEKRQWKDLLELSEGGLKQKPDASFTLTLGKLRDQAVKGIVETAYEAKQFSQVVSLVKKHGTGLSNSQTSGDIFAMAAGAALELNDKTQALSLFDEAMTRAPSTDLEQRRTLLRASLSEDRYDYEGAIKEYLRYFSIAPKGQPLDEREIALRDRAELLNVLVSNPTLLQTMGNHPRICSQDFLMRCSRLKSFAVFLSPELPLSPKAKDYVAEASRLRRRKGKVTVGDLNRLLSQFQKSRKDQAAETYLAMFLFSSLTSELHQAYDAERIFINRKLPVNKSLAKLSARLKKIKELETFTENCNAGTTSDFGLTAKREMVNIYSDLKQDVDELQEKLSNSGAAAQSEYAVQLKQMSERFGDLARESSGSSENEAGAPVRKVSALDSFPLSTGESKEFKGVILAALKSHRWGLVSYLVRVGVEQRKLNAGDAEAVQEAMSHLIADELKGGVS